MVECKKQSKSYADNEIMITHFDKYYLYRHISHQTGKPFYIGIGKKLKEVYRKYSTEYGRAHLKHGRTEEWYEIAKQGYDVEILFECNSQIDIKQKEVEFIALYGRIDIGTGILVNMSPGGDYFPTGSTKIALKSLESAKRNGTHARRIKILKENLHKRRKTFKKVYVYDSNGNFLKECHSLIECSKFVKAGKGYVSTQMSKGRMCKGFKLSPIFVGEKMTNTNLIIGKIQTSRRVCQVHPVTYNVIRTYGSLGEAALEMNISKGNLGVAIKNKTRLKEFFWKDDDGVKFVPIKKRYRILKSAS